MCSIKEGTHPFVGPLPSPSTVVASTYLANIEQLRFFSPTFFRAGEIHNHLPVWDCLVVIAHLKRTFLTLSGRVWRSTVFSSRLKETSRVARTTCHVRPLYGSAILRFVKDFEILFLRTLLDWVAAGVLDVWGRVGGVTPPHLVVPLPVEPSVPRVCHDERYLNLWIRDLPFRLDHLPDLPRYVLPGHFQTSFDDKSGYQHVLLHSSSRIWSWME